MLAATNIRTIECRVKFDDLSGIQEIVAKSQNSQGIVIRTGRLNNGRSCLQDLPADTYYMAITGTAPKTIRFLVQ